MSRPRHLGELIGWFRREWASELPTRIHTRGVEPDSALGAPTMAPQMMARLSAAVVLPSMPLRERERAEKIALATDHDNRLDTWFDEDVRRTPLLAALTKMRHTHPLSQKLIEACAYFDWDWQTVGRKRNYPDELTALMLEGALNRLYSVWSQLDQHEVAQPA